MISPTEINNATVQILLPKTLTVPLVMNYLVCHFTYKYLAPCQKHSPNRNFRDQPQCYLHLHLGAGHPMIGESEAAKENSSRSPTFYRQYTVLRARLRV